MENKKEKHKLHVSHIEMWSKKETNEKHIFLKHPKAIDNQHDII